MITDTAIKEIRGHVSGDILQSEPLSGHTTYRTGGRAELLVIARNCDDTRWVYRFAHENGFPLTIIGAGSNVIAPDEGIEGIVLKTKRDSARIDFLDENKVVADSGVYLDQLIREAALKGLGGFEHVMGIPGTVGGAVVMNAGTRNGDISSLIAEVEVLTPTELLPEMTPDEMDFGYRRSIFQGKDWLIIDVIFELRPMGMEEIMGDLDRIWEERNGLYPMHMPNAGSVFRNPEGSHAGYLIEQAGLKGTRVGGAEVSEKHGNFIVNRGDATSGDIIALIGLLREKIHDKYGITLQLEQKILPTRIDQ